MKILFIGDVFGKPGRGILAALLPGLKAEFAADLTVVNGENAAGGLGISRRTAAELFAAGADVITTGNHAFKQPDAVALYEEEPRVLRPANYPPGAPGRGWVLVEAAGQTVAVVNLQGRVFMSPIDCPFRAADDLLAGPLAGADAVVIDMHAEASSEKQALAWRLDGRAAAVVGTHTHVQTADARVLPGGTAYITDLGLTGPKDSVIGMDAAMAAERMIQQRSLRFKVARGPAILQGALVTLDPATGRAAAIEPITRDQT